MHVTQTCVSRSLEMALPACGSKLASGGRHDMTETSSASRHSYSGITPTGGLEAGANSYVENISEKIGRYR